MTRLLKQGVIAAVLICVLLGSADAAPPQPDIEMVTVQGKENALGEAPGGAGETAKSTALSPGVYFIAILDGDGIVYADGGAETFQVAFKVDRPDGAPLYGGLEGRFNVRRRDSFRVFQVNAPTVVHFYVTDTVIDDNSGSVDVAVLRLR